MIILGLLIMFLKIIPLFKSLPVCSNNSSSVRSCWVWCFTLVILVPPKIFCGSWLWVHLAYLPMVSLSPQYPSNDEGCISRWVVLLVSVWGTGVSGEWQICLSVCTVITVSTQITLLVALDPPPMSVLLPSLEQSQKLPFVFQQSFFSVQFELWFLF